MCGKIAGGRAVDGPHQSATRDGRSERGSRRFVGTYVLWVDECPWGSGTYPSGAGPRHGPVFRSGGPRSPDLTFPASTFTPLSRPRTAVCEQALSSRVLTSFYIYIDLFEPHFIRESCINSILTMYLYMCGPAIYAFVTSII